MLNDHPPKRSSESATEMVEVVLPNDANPMGFMLGGNVMRLIDLAGAIAAIRHARAPMVTAAVDGLEFVNPVRVGDFIVLKSRVTATFSTSLEVEVLVYSEGALSGERQMTSRAHLTFVTLARDGVRAQSAAAAGGHRGRPGARSRRPRPPRGAPGPPRRPR